ncbi:hypothetical protein AWC22_12815 [Mycobacterium riyadhense]|uniref:Uncharacterized protein n=2 Tax=Mycobacterium riyadhense TaxID=486698 RepID=A0A1X2D9N0_9MYCO|nr:hypothetical protein [Mycobacterium riyadhense]ORW84828.1 hypothetical protein AWC22_12815 [Mycobacterium riyadhense]
MLGMAANSGDLADNADTQAGQSERELKLNDALAKFPANEQESAAKLAAVGDPNQMTQMAQQLPQMATGVAQSVAGALGGLMNPLSQIPQQVAQMGQQAMQAGMGALQHGAGGAAEAGEALPGELLGADGAAGELAEAGGAGGGGIAGTTPTALLGPPPTPSAGTVPTSTPTVPSAASNAPESATPPRGGMGGMPMVPPGAMHGAPGAGTDTKPDTKRVVGPTVKNGAPVQGRITTPPPASPVPTVTKRVEGKPVASRRIVLPGTKPDDDADSSR